VNSELDYETGLGVMVGRINARLTEKEMLIAELRALHVKNTTFVCNCDECADSISNAGCSTCETIWPCETIRLIEEYDDQG